ncbi:MAG: class I SAM-dependent methyltransferase family protein [Pseudomonadota bacterium]
MQMELTELTKPLPPFHFKAVKFGLARILMRTIGRLSKGIEIGCAHGFDSGVMLDHVYDNRAEGRFLIGRLIDRIYLDAPGWAGIRNRGELLRETILAEAKNIAAERPADAKELLGLVDLACGGGRYLIAALRTLEDRGTHVQATLRDYRAENVEKARTNAKAGGVNATIEVADAFCDADLARLAPPDIVVVSGLHEIIDDDRRVAQHFVQIARLLRSGGRLIVTVQPDHPQVEFIARVLTTHQGRPWAMRLRSVGLISAWAQAAGFVVESVTMEPLGIFGVLVARKV